MNPIANDSLEPSTRPWVLVAAVLAALFVASLVLLGAHAAPGTADGDDQAHVLDNGL